MRVLHFAGRVSTEYARETPANELSERRFSGCHGDSPIFPRGAYLYCSAPSGHESGKPRRLLLRLGLVGVLFEFLLAHRRTFNSRARHLATGGPDDRVEHQLPIVVVGPVLVEM